MFQNQLINAVVQWEWQLKMAEEKQKNLRGEPFATAVAPVAAPAIEGNVSIRSTAARRPTNRPVYASCTPERCG